MTAKTMTEEQMVGMVRNALLVAGYEMGQTGDHWPVINATIYSLARDWEESRIQKNVDAEMKIHIYEQLGLLEKSMGDYPAESRSRMVSKIKELRDIYDAYFSALDEKVVAPLREDEIPFHIVRAKEIISTLGGEDA